MLFDFFYSFFFNLNLFNYVFDFNFFFQFILLYVLYNIYTSSSTYYTILYVLLYIVFLGIALTYYCMDVFTAFLFLSESVIIFISILLIFYLNVYGSDTNSIKHFNLIKSLGVVLLSVLNVYYVFYDQEEFYINTNFEVNIFYDDFYYNLNTSLFNDLYALYLNFFFLNSFSFIIIVLLLLIASLVCVNINISLKSGKLLNFNNFFMLLDFFKDFTKFIFMRKQTLNDQMGASNSFRFFSKKND